LNKNPQNTQALFKPGVKVAEKSCMGANWTLGFLDIPPAWRPPLCEYLEGKWIVVSKARSRRILSCLTRFLARFGPDSLQDLRPQHLEAHLKELAETGLAPGSLRQHHAIIRAFCRWLVCRNLMLRDPVASVQAVRLEQRAPVWLTPEEIGFALALAETYNILCEVRLALDTGLRMSELRYLRWMDLDTGRRLLTVRKSKSRRPRCVPLTLAALDILGRQHRLYGSLPYVFPGSRGGGRRAGRWTEPRPRGRHWWVRVALKPLQRRIPKFHVARGTGRGWHLFRHTFASRAVQAGVPIYKVSKWLGHASVKTTEIYAHLAEGYDPDIEKI